MLHIFIFIKASFLTFDDMIATEIFTKTNIDDEFRNYDD